MKPLLTALRWIAFIPAGIIAGTLASLFGRLSSFWFAGPIQDAMCGALGAVGMIVGGFYTAPVRHPAVKWTMILLCAALGILTVIGGLLSENDRLKFIVMGSATTITAFCYCGVPANELVKEDET